MTNEAFDHIAKEKLQNYTATVPVGLWEKIRLPNISNPVDPFDAFLKDKLENISAAVPVDMWDRIKPEEEDRKRFFFMMPRATMVAASLLLLIITGSVSAYLYYQKILLPQKATETNSVNQPSTLSNGQKNNQPNNKNNSLIPTTGNETNEEPGTSTKPESIPLIEAEESKEHSVKEEASKNSIPTSENTIKKIIANKFNNTGKYKNTNPFSTLPRANNFGNNLQPAPISSGNTTASSSINNIADNEEAYIQTTKFDASFMNQQKKFSLYKSLEKEIAYKNHAGTIKNVVICPSDRKMRNTNWDLEVYASPDYAFKSVSSNSATQQFMDRKDSSETARVSFSAGFRIVKPINDHFSIKTGLNYSQINEAFTYRTENEIKTTTVITVRNITLANGTTVTVSDTSILQQIGFKTNTVKNRYKSIDVPVLLGYQFGNDDFRIGINAGLMINLSSWYQGVILDTALTATPITKDNNVVYKNNIGLGIYTGINISKRINYNTSIFAEPYLRYNLSNMTTPQSSYNQRMTIGGLAIGLKFNLNNR
ncbi:MAG: outer membrane beta-barrel protein [Sediminibacterium sp.]|nr:outer membrane beta-barrel protein [Sediminibacterium sp.]